ncbi:hypothetical protein AWZ03_013950 [Drosophila navojoa]|uniref:ELYS-like domain-containing protein n=2 Tax=Drosophila navojoa TaxID=7232 RepID=A0A484AT65_DRONA|nr:hypothetical protein AWZ03_013950 [Drosophila navojoa]
MLPQFHNVEPHWSLSKLEMYELIMSMGLEQDRMWLLKSCARSCLDGSLLCNMMSSTKLSLSVITNWIVRRARHIKQRCADLCEGIFDCGAYALEERERKEMQHLNNQLLRLSEVQHLLVKLTKARLNLELVDDLEFTQNTLKVLYDYQRILHWLIESGILPESSQEQQQSMPSIRRDYDKRRAQLKRSAKHNAKLYVDELMHQYGFQAELKKLNEDRLYPPQSLQTLMRLMLLQDFNLEQKHELMLYLILDLDQFYKSGEHELYKDFAESFGLAEPFVKCVRSFWFLDKGDHETALDILYRGRTGRGVYTEWQTKHLIETLLHYNANAEALQVVNMPPGYVSSELKLQVLLANNNIPEAFHHARFCMDKDGRPLLEHFFQHCIVEGKFNVLATLCLRDNEEQLVYRQLRQCKTRAADCIQLILLLKRCKYIEAVSFMDEVAAERELSDETSGILTAYRTTMAPVTQSIAGSYFRVRNRLNGNHFTNFSPEPFSCQLAKQLANGHMGDIFQSSAMSAHWATRHPNDPSFFRLDSRNIPFLRSASKALKELPQLHRYVRPTPYQCAEKRLYPCSTPGTLGPQSKRRRLLVEDETVPNFPHSSHEEYDLMYEDNAMNMDLHSLRVANDLLHPPSYLLTKSEADAATSITQGQRPTILKSRLLRRQPMQRPNFSFLPPIPLDKTMQDVEMMEMDEEEQTVSDLDGDEIFVEIEQQLESSTRPEAEPEQQQHNSSDTESEYMSPVASANASFASFSGCNREQQLESKQQPEQQHEQQQEPSRSFTMAPPTGPQPRSSLSSGFGSFATVQTGSTAGSLQLNAFQPPVCSSKMFESTSRVVSSTYQVKMSERTTICGDIDEPSSLATGWSMPSALGKTVHIGSSADRPMLQMLDTTLGMSSYDMTAMDAMAEQETERVGQREPEPEPVTEPEPEAKPEADAEPEAEPEPELEPELEPEPELEQEPEPEAESIPSRKQASPLAYIDLEDDENEAEVEAEVAAEVEAEAEGDDVEVDEEELEVGHEELAPLQPHESQVDEEDDARDDVEQQEQCTSSSFDQTTIPLSFNRGSPSYSVSSELSDLSSPRTDAPVYSIVVESTNSISDSRSPASHTPNSFLPSDTNVSQNSSPRAHGVGGEGGSNRSLYRANSLETVDDLDTTKGSLEEDDDVDEEDECVIALDGTEVRGYVARAEPVAACNSAELFAFKQQDETEQQANQAPCPSLVATANSDSVMAYTINLDSVDSVEVQPAVATVTSIGGSSNDSVATVAFSEHKDQQDKQDQQQEQEQEPELPMNVDEVEEKAVAPAQSALDVADSIAINLDSDMDSNPSLLVLSDKEEMDVEMKDEGEKNNKPLVETVTVIDTETETKEPDQPLEIQQPIQVDSAEQSIHLDSDKEVDAEEENKSQDISRQVLPRTRGSLRSLSGTPPLQQCRIRLRNENHRRSVSSTRSTPSPSLRSRLRSASSSGTVAEDQLPENDAETSRGTTDSPDPTKYPVTKRRSLRGGSLPPISTVPVSTPKRRRKLLPRPMEVIDETAEAQSSTTPRTRSRRQLGQSTASVPVLVAAEQNVDSKTSHNKLRSNSEPPSPIVVAAPVKGRRRVKPSIEEPLKKDVAPRNLRSRRSTTEADAEQPTTSSSARSTVSDSSVPLKKRGRSKK